MLSLEGNMCGTVMRGALRSVTTYAAAGGFPGHRRAMTKSKKPDPRQAGTAAHNHDSLRVAT